MKTKNLFKTLIVVALIVPFLVGLSACGKKKYEKISAEKAYTEVAKAFVTTSEGGEPEPLDPINGIFEEENFTIKSKTTFKSGSQDLTLEANVGYGKDKGLFGTLKLNGETTNQNFIVANDGETAGYTQYLYDAEDEQNPYQKNDIPDLDTVKGKYLNESVVGGVGDALDGVDLSAYFVSDYEAFKAVIDEENGSVQGRKYKDGTYSIIIKGTMQDPEQSDQEPGQAGTTSMSCEIGVKNGKLVKLSMTVEEETDGVVSVISVVMEFEYKFNTSYLPKNFSKWEN